MDADKHMQTVEIPPVSFDEFSLPTPEQWREEAEKALKGAPFDKKMFTSTFEGITLNPLYWRDDAAGFDAARTNPGEAPYLRGCDSGGYSSQPWGIAQGCEVADVAEANAVLRDELARGTTELNLLLDDATRAGADVPDPVHPRRLSLACLKDLKILFEGIDVTQFPLHVNAGVSALPLLGLFEAFCDAKKISVNALSGCIGADPLCELTARGSLSVSLEQAFDALAASIRWADEKAPQLRTILMDSKVYHLGGASAIDEVAALMASAIAGVKALMDRGLDIGTICRQIRFSVSLGANFFMEIAKLRAMRVLWSTVVAAFGGDEEAQKIDVFATTSSFTSTTYDPYVNLLRTSTQAFSAVVGGVNSLQITCFDEATRPSTEQARRIARNQQIMLQTEFDLTAPVDPAGGSWYVESLTAQVADKIWSAVQHIEAQGGIVKALEAGSIQDAINATLQDRFKKLASRSERSVGSNMYANTTEQPLEASTFDATSFAARRSEVLKSLRTSRNDAECKAALEAVSGTLCIDGAAKAFGCGATLGEVAAALGTKGESPVVTALAPHRWTEQFEALRGRTEAYKAATGETVKIFLANLGPIPQHKPRADFSTGFMEVANFEVLKNDGFPTIEEAAKAAIESGASVATICSTDDSYPELVAPLTRAIKEGAPSMKVLLAGAPAAEFKDSYIEAGVSDFIHVRANCLKILTEIQKERGIC